MADLKTKQTQADVEAFILSAPERRQDDARTILAIMRKATRQPAVMWGQSLVGFGKYFYRYDSGHEGLYFLTGFSPRKANLVIYIMPGFGELAPLMKKLGKYKTGKSCLYLNKLADVDLDVLSELIIESVKIMKQRYPTGAKATKAAEAGKKRG